MTTGRPGFATGTACLLAGLLLGGCAGDASEGDGGAGAASTTEATASTRTAAGAGTAAQDSAVTGAASTTASADPVTSGDRAATEALVAFARGPSEDTFATLPLADDVGLGLGERIVVSRPVADLADPDAWVVDLGGFRAREGSTSALELLDGLGEDPHVVSVGDHPPCAGPVTAAPPEVSDLRRVSIQPEEIESCLQWFAVDLFVEPAGAIAAVGLDLYEP